MRAPLAPVVVPLVLLLASPAPAGSAAMRQFPIGFDTGPAVLPSQFTAAAAAASTEAQHGMNMIMLYQSVPNGHTTAELAQIKLFMDRCAAIGVAVAYDLSKLVEVAGGNKTPRMAALQREVEASYSIN